LFELVDEDVRGVDIVKRQIVRSKEMLLLAPARIGLKNLRMTEPRPMIGEDASDRGRTRLGTETLDKLVMNQTELSRAHNVLAGPLPSLNDQLLFCNLCASFSAFLCVSLRPLRLNCYLTQRTLRNAEDAEWLLLVDLLDQPQRVVACDERHVLVSAEILEQLEELARI